MKRILVISGDILPYPGLPTTGAGLRAWGIGKGLESKGHTVLLAMPQMPAGRFTQVPTELQDLLYVKNDLTQFVKRHKPDMVVLQHWCLASFLDNSLEVPLVIDFHGPLLLETQFQDNPTLEKLQRDKITALHKADFFTCAGEKQRHYFFPWLMLAGCDLREDLIHTIPVSLSPDLPTHASAGEISFVYGGVFLPWQNPVKGLYTLIEALEKHNTGHLKFFGGKHPVVAFSTGRFDELRAQLEQSSKVLIQPMVPREQLIQEYCRSHVAIDIMQRNAERELAFTTRTVEYLWCGLPVIYNDYAELSSYIKGYNAGWALDPQDTDGLQQVVEDIIASPELVAERSLNAQRLVRERLTWDKTIAPLDAFCRNPYERKKGQLRLNEKEDSLRKELTYLHKKIQYHIKHEGFQMTFKRSLSKLLRYGR